MPPAFTTRPLLRGTFGMVSSTHWLASQSAMAVLERGGNAFDAAVAAGLVLEVVEPHLNGLGGEVPIIFWSQVQQRVGVLCGQGPAPRTATIQRFGELGLDMVPGSGPLAACVPGAFGGWMALLLEHGTLPLGEVIQYAIGYAEAGYPLVPNISDAIAHVEELFRTEWRESGRIYLADGIPPPGTLFRNPDLAGTFRRLLKEAEAVGGDRDLQIEAALRAFYEGFVAEAIEAGQQMPAIDSSGQRHAGLLTAADLAGWRARTELPVSADYRGWTVFKTGPWGQGPVFLQQLKLLEGFDLRAAGFLSLDHVHAVVECAKLAFADRDAWYGDPDFVEVPLDTLLDSTYADDRRKLIQDRASLELRPGAPAGREPRLPRWPESEVAARHWTGAASQAVGDTGHQEPGRGDTCHVDVADRFGNLVAATPSGGWLQSSPVIPGLGFCLGTRAQMFNLEPGLPNSLEGGKRPRTTLTPSLAFRDGQPCLAFGTPGGDQQDQWSLNFFVAHADFGLSLQEAIDAPNFHSQHFPSSFVPHRAFPGRLSIERREQTQRIEELRLLGHDVVVEGPWSLGRLCAVGRDPETGQLVAAANPRGMQGYAVGR